MDTSSAMHTSESSSPAEPFDNEPQLDSDMSEIEDREAKQERYLLAGVLVLAVIAVAVVGWRLFWDSNETSAAYTDPVTQICAVDKESLVALGGKPAPNNAFWDGLHVVGESNILPGTYKSSNAGTCYWARLSGTSGTEQEVIASNQAGGGRQTVTILDTDEAFTSMGCGEWSAVAD